MFSALKTKDIAMYSVTFHDPANVSTLARAIVDDSPRGANNDFSGVE
jgi:hypothetical protein